MRRPPSSLLLRSTLWLALGAAVATAGYAATRLRASAELVRASEPWQASPEAAVGSLLVVGDSTAVGTGASGGLQSLPGLLAQRHPRLRIVNRARDGARYEDFIAQLQQSDEQFDHVLVLGGGNDVIRGTSRAELRSQVRRALGLAHQRGERVIVMPPGNVGNAPFFPRPLGWWMDRRSQVLHGAVQDAARATGATYVGLYQQRRDDPFAQRPGELHAADGLHPSDAGYRLWLQEFDRQAGPLLGGAAPRASVRPDTGRPAPA